MTVEGVGFNSSEKIDELAAAFAKAQGAFGVLRRTKEVEVTSRRTGERYKFRYAPLDDVIELIKRPLAESGLAVVQLMATDPSGVVRIQTVLMHSSGQWVMSISPIYSAGSGNQDFGSAVTYQRRYALCAMLGLAGEEDDDANIAEANTIHEPQANPQANPQESSQDKSGMGPIEMAYALAKKIQVAENEVDAYIEARFGKKKEELSALQSVSLKQTIERLPTRSAFFDEKDQWEQKKSKEQTAKKRKDFANHLLGQEGTDASS